MVIQIKILIIVCVIFCISISLYFILHCRRNIYDCRCMHIPLKLIIVVHIIICRYKGKFIEDNIKHPFVISIDPYNIAFNKLMSILVILFKILNIGINKP